MTSPSEYGSSTFVATPGTVNARSRSRPAATPPGSHTCRRALHSASQRGRLPRRRGVAHQTNMLKVGPADELVAVRAARSGGPLLPQIRESQAQLCSRQRTTIVAPMEGVRVRGDRHDLVAVTGRSPGRSVVPTVARYRPHFGRAQPFPVRPGRLTEACPVHTVQEDHETAWRPAHPAASRPWPGARHAPSFPGRNTAWSPSPYSETSTLYFPGAPGSTAFSGQTWAVSQYLSALGPAACSDRAGAVPCCPRSSRFRAETRGG